MYEWLTKISITCFAASYLVTLVLEISRLFFRAPIRLAVMLAFAIAGLLAQTAYLVVAIKEGVDRGLPLSRWYDWCLLAAWVLAATYIVYTFRRPKSVAGLFLLPVILILIVLAEFFFGPGFPAEKVALLRMGQIHGVGLLLGTVTVILGFVAGVMYLAQSYRLKRKLPRREGLKLPSLEWLQRVNRRALSLSSVFIAGGLIAGVILNLINHRVPWTEPLVIMSGVLLLWLIVAMLFEYLYKPAREGRKVAYLTIASFIFLGLVLSTVFFDFTQSHGQATPKKSESKSDRSGEQTFELLVGISLISPVSVRPERQRHEYGGLPSLSMDGFGKLGTTHKPSHPCLLVRQVDQFEWLERSAKTIPRPLPPCAAGESVSGRRANLGSCQASWRGAEEGSRFLSSLVKLPFLPHKVAGAGRKMLVTISFGKPSYRAERHNRLGTPRVTPLREGDQ